MRNPFPTRRKQQDEKPEVTTAAVDDVAESSSLEKEIIRQSESIDGATDAAPGASASDEPPAIEYVTGWKLWSMLVSVASVFVLVLLDMSIVATVSDATAVLSGV
jgi:hypothetical protein